MKPKYITVENYKEFKPSEFIRSFVADIEVAEAIKGFNSYLDKNM